MKTNGYFVIALGTPDGGYKEFSGSELLDFSFTQECAWDGLTTTNILIKVANVSVRDITGGLAIGYSEEAKNKAIEEIKQLLSEGSTSPSNGLST